MRRRERGAGIRKEACTGIAKAGVFTFFPIREARRCDVRTKYASHLASRAALHLDLFEQPGQKRVFQQPAKRRNFLLREASFLLNSHAGAIMGGADDRPWFP